MDFSGDGRQADTLILMDRSITREEEVDCCKMWSTWTKIRSVKLFAKQGT